jgi:pyruvate kinase
VTGELSVVRTAKEAEEVFQEGNILVAPYTTNEMLPILKRASAIVVEESGHNTHAAVVGLALEIPVVTGAENATLILKRGSVVTVDSDRGIIYYGSAKI